MQLNFLERLPCGYRLIMRRMCKRRKIKPAPDLQCAGAHQYKNFHAPPAHNFVPVNYAVEKLKNGEKINNGKYILRRIEAESAGFELFTEFLRD